MANFTLTVDNALVNVYAEGYAKHFGYEINKLKDESKTAFAKRMLLKFNHRLYKLGKLEMLEADKATLLEEAEVEIEGISITFSL